MLLFISNICINSGIIAYYPVMVFMPQWDLPHTEVEQAHRTVGL